MTNYVDTFGGQTLPPSEYKLNALSLTANATLFWPYSYTGTGLVIAKLNTIASTGAYTLTFPDATQVSTGEDSLWVNNSASTITLHDAAGGTIGTVAAGVSKYVFLLTNSTAAGTWAIFTYGTGTSAADASALAGYGVKATAATLSQAIPSTETASPVTIDATTSRAQAYILSGGSVAVTFPAAAAAGSDFFFYVKNAGTGTVTLTTVGGEFVDGATTLGLNPQESCIVFSDATHWHTVGLGRSTIYQFTKLVKDLAGLGTYTLSSSDASNKLIQFTGAPSGATTITVPAVVSIYYVEVSTSNAYTVTLKTAAGTGVALAQNARSILYCDGVNVVSAQTASAPAANTTVSNDTATNATMYPTWVTANTGDLPLYVSSTKISFNPSTSTLTATNFAGKASTVTGATFTTALTVNTGTVTLTGAGANSSVVTIGAGAVGISGSNTGDQTNVAGTAAGLSATLVPASGGTGVANNNSSTWTISGSYATTVTVTGVTGVTLPTSGTLAILGANTFTAAQNITATALGNISNATVTFDWATANVKTYTATGSTVTWAFSNIPASGTFGEMLIVATNQGAYTLAAGTTVNWELPTSPVTYTTTFATYLAANLPRVALASTGVDNFYLWTVLGVVYGKLV